jgi:hypothetical protein
VLDDYVTRTQRLLQNPAPATGLYPAATVKDYVNIARKQLAGEAQCIRKIGTIPTVAAQREYSFANISLGTPASTGIAGVFNVRRINYGVGDGQQYVTPRPWEWFDQYCLNNPVPIDYSAPPGSHPPVTWAQYAQGSAAPTGGSSQSGSFYLDPIPDDVWTLYCDCACYPVTLVDDTTVEAIPYPFTDAVPFFAAYYALLGAQMQARRADAEAFYGYYKDFLGRARDISNAAVLTWQYEGANDPAQTGKAGR